MKKKKGRNKEEEELELDVFEETLLFFPFTPSLFLPQLGHRQSLVAYFFITGGPAVEEELINASAYSKQSALNQSVFDRKGGNARFGFSNVNSM